MWSHLLRGCMASQGGSLEAGFTSSVRTWFIRTSRGKNLHLRLFTCLWNLDMRRNIVGINQNQLATWLEGHSEEGNGGDFENSALNKAPWVPGVGQGWIKSALAYADIQSLEWMASAAGGRGFCSSFSIRAFVVPGLESLNRAIPAPFKGWLVNTECWVDLVKVVLFLAKCWFIIKFSSILQLRINWSLRVDQWERKITILVILGTFTEK